MHTSYVFSQRRYCNNSSGIKILKNTTTMIKIKVRNHRRFTPATISLQSQSDTDRQKNIICKKKNNRNTKVLYHIIKDCCIDGTIVTFKNVVIIDDINVWITLGILTSSLCNNILLNSIVKIKNNLSFKERGSLFFRFGLFTHLPGAFIYSKLLPIMILYVSCFALGMSCISNLRYTLLTYIENKYDVNKSQELILRIINNILGYMQSIYMIKIITYITYLLNLL